MIISRHLTGDLSDAAGYTGERYDSFAEAFAVADCDGGFVIVTDSEESAPDPLAWKIVRDA